MTLESQNLKIVFLGDAGCGKSSILNQYISRNFNPSQDSTIGASYFCSNVEIRGQLYKLNFWDTAGQERFDSISSVYCRNSQGVIIVCDARSSDSVNSLTKWYSKTIKENSSDDLAVVIAINKIDLIEPGHNSIITQIEDFGEQINAPVIKTSAKYNLNIQELFDILVSNLSHNGSILTRKSIALCQSDHCVLISRKKLKQGCC